MVALEHSIRENTSGASTRERVAGAHQIPLDTEPVSSAVWTKNPTQFSLIQSDGAPSSPDSITRDRDASTRVRLAIHSTRTKPKDHGQETC